MDSLSISTWNIQGLSSSTFGVKSLNNGFQNYVKNIIILQETWSTADVATHCPPHYREIVLPAQKLSTVHKGRASGGLIIWYKSKLHKHIDTVKKGKYHIWLKIKQKTEKERNISVQYMSLLQTPHISMRICSMN